MVGELWTTTPKAVKIYDIHDIPESLASTNANGDISAELVSVGQGTAQEIDGKDVKGKFVSRSRQAVLASLHPCGRSRAIGAVGISAIGAGDRAADFPDRNRIDHRESPSRTPLRGPFPRDRA